MTGNKIYLQPRRSVVNTILDIAELQKGKTTFTDTAHGKVCFLVRMYAFTYEYRFTVTDIGNNRSKVKLEVRGNSRYQMRHIIREFALLDSMMIGEAKIEFAEGQTTDNRRRIGGLAGSWL